MALSVGPSVGAAIVLFFFCFPLALGGCDKKKEKTSAPPLADERPLLDPEKRGPEGRQRCQMPPGEKLVTVRSSGGGPPEVGTAAAVAGGFAVGALDAGESAHARLHFLDGQGLHQIVDLGEVHGEVDPPEVVGFEKDALVAVVDSDAGHTRLQVSKVSALRERPQVARGPEVLMRRGESARFSFAVRSSADGSSKGMLVWDDFDPARSRSEVRGLAFDPQSLEKVHAEAEITSPEEDAVSPTLVPTARGYFLLYLSYGELSPEVKDKGEDLVEEPPRTLRAARLDDKGVMDGPPIDVTSPAENVLAYDASLGAEGALFVAYRTADSGRNEGGSAIQLRRVGTDGSITSGAAAHDELGLGAPALFANSGDPVIWLTARGSESENLFGFVEEDLRTRDFDLELGLLGKIPLARHQDRLLVMIPDDDDVELGVVVCSGVTNKSTRVPRAGAK